MVLMEDSANHLRFVILSKEHILFLSSPGYLILVPVYQVTWNHTPEIVIFIYTS
jgi:hypothetical protein